MVRSFVLLCPGPSHTTHSPSRTRTTSLVIMPLHLLLRPVSQLLCVSHIAHIYNISNTHHAALPSWT